MKTPDQLAVEVKQAFETINQESMAGLPIVNPMLEVDTIGFLEHEGRNVGIIVTPWLMTLAVFPGDDDDWRDVVVGTKASFEFPARKYDFLANEIDGIGKYYGFALYSPMHEFEHQPHAVASAEAFLEVLMVENENAENELDEERLAMFLAGEDMETIKQKECAKSNPVVDGETTLSDAAPKEIDRRAFLSGGFRPTA
ncbi:MAG: [NiFe]-hydrogenase assembly chaperone HybE [Magnetovibrio sp.]|nr:[NiFe]-hydrogenase assembly chaperone HybE [Magnetovibrio sp.]